MYEEKIQALSAKPSEWYENLFAMIYCEEPCLPVEAGYMLLSCKRRT